MKKLFGFILLICLCIPNLHAQQQPDMSAAIPADPAVRIGKLDNGLTYYIRHNGKPEKQAEFYILHDVGAIQEEDAQIGLAHFLEHMAFNGTKNFPDKNLLNYLEKIGVKFGANLNAGTGQDMTVYNISSVPLTREGIIDTALLILHDWSYYIALDPEEIDKERGVIIEEFRTGNTAGRRIHEKTAPAIYNNSKYADRNVIGNIEALKSFSHKELEDFYHRWYRTDLQAIVVVGDFDVDQMEAKIKKTMSDIPAVQNPEPKTMVAIPDNEAPIVTIATDPELTSTSATVYIKREPMPKEMNDKIVGAKINTLLAMIMHMTNQRLSEIAQKPDAPFIGAGAGQGAITATCDVMMGVASAREGESLKAFEALYSELEKIQRFGFTEPELERAKNDMLRSAQSSFNNRNDRRSGEFVQAYLENYRNNMPIPTAETEYGLDSLLISTTSLTEINAVAQQIVTDNNQVVVLTGPEKENVPMPSEADVKAAIEKIRNTELEAYADNTVKEPLISEEPKGSKVVKTETDRFGATVWTLANGIKVVAKPTDFKADEVQFNASRGGGLSLVSDEDYPSGELMSTLIELSGVGKFSMTDLTKQLSGKAVSIVTNVGSYDHGFAGSTSPKDIESLLQLIYLYGTAPRFNQADFDLMIDKYKATLANASSNPAYVMQDSVTNTIFKRNPRRQILSTERLGKVNFEAMPRIHRELFGNEKDFVYTFVGNIDPETLKPLVEKYIGSLPAGKKALNWKDDKVIPAWGEVTNRFSVPMQTPKTTILTLLRGTQDYTPENLLTLNAIKLILDMRYVTSIREEKGGTYGVRTSASLYNVPRSEYVLQMNFDTDPEKADELTGLIMNEVQTLATEGPKAEDLAKVKEFLTKQRADDLKRNGTWMGFLNSYYTDGIDFNADYDKLLSELNAEKIKAFAAKIVKDNNVTRIVMEPKK